ncbi:MAG: hypothetical protein HC810_05675 [Acaryochloridaceae cyanobacterium RL_2_7]|nr:hypothetical protein [Acaryochloridaceae cyanobacterium RL_2_7]
MSDLVPRRRPEEKPVKASSGLSKLPDLPSRRPIIPKPGRLPGNRPIVASYPNRESDDDFMGYID